MSLTTKKIKTTLAGAATFLAFFAPALASAQETVTYTVKSGDTLSEIAEKYNTTVEKLAEKNKIKDIKAVFKGDERYMILSAYYRQNNYHPLYSLRGMLGLLFQLHFFISSSVVSTASHETRGVVRTAVSFTNK